MLSLKRSVTFLALILLSVASYCGTITVYSNGSGSIGGGVEPTPSPSPTPDPDATFGVETVGDTVSSGTITTFTLGFTCTSITGTLVVPVAFRRNASQTVTSATYNGVAMTMAQENASVQLRGQLWYIQAPTVGTHNIVVVLSGSTPGGGMTAISFKNTASIPYNSGSHGTQSVTTSSVTATTAVGDIMLTMLLKQDPSSSEPTLNTGTATLQKDFNFSSATNGAHFKVTTKPATSTSEQVNYSWTTAANHAHVYTVITP